MDTLEPTYSPRLFENRDRAGALEPCFLCGKGIKTRRYMVHLRTDGMLVDRDAVLAEAEDQGWFDIGPECQRKMPRRFVADTAAG